MAFIAGIGAVCVISVIAMSWKEIKQLFHRKKTHWVCQYAPENLSPSLRQNRKVFSI